MAKFIEQRVELPKHDCDVVLVFPGGKSLTIQLRPSNADVTNAGGRYNGSLDIILPETTAVCVWIGDDMQAAPEAYPGKNHPHERLARQLVLELPGDYD